MVVEKRANLSQTKAAVVRFGVAETEASADVSVDLREEAGRLTLKALHCAGKQSAGHRNTGSGGEAGAQNEEPSLSDVIGEPALVFGHLIKTLFGGLTSSVGLPLECVDCPLHHGLA